MKQAAKALEKTKSENALKNTAYTTFGKANPRFSGQEAPTPDFLYDSMLELCEKLFGSEIDQPTFEDGIRALFGNQAYHIFTIDKLLSSLVKTVWSLIDSNRETYAANGEIFKLLVDDRRYPTTAQAQQCRACCWVRRTPLPHRMATQTTSAYFPTSGQGRSLARRRR
jgi:histone deacetylase complex regulatory component SIN3